MFLGGLFSGDEFHTQLVGTLGELPQDSLAVAFLIVVLALIGVFLALGQHGVDQPRQIVGGSRPA